MVQYWLLHYASCTPSFYSLMNELDSRTLESNVPELVNVFLNVSAIVFVVVSQNHACAILCIRLHLLCLSCKILVQVNQSVQPLIAWEVEITSNLSAALQDISQTPSATNIGKLLAQQVGSQYPHPHAHMYNHH
jgi:hypothetical protein